MKKALSYVASTAGAQLAAISFFGFTNDGDLHLLTPTIFHIRNVGNRVVVVIRMI